MADHGRRDSHLLYAGPLYMLSRGSSMMRMQRISFYSASPMLGPAVGNTSITVQVQNGSPYITRLLRKDSV